MENTNSKSSLYIVGTVLAVAVLGWLIYSFGLVSKAPVSSNENNNQVNVNSNNTVVAPDNTTLKNNKAEIMSIVAKNRVLTKDERTKILSTLNGDAVKFYNFTEQEKKQIIDALNRK